MNRKNNTTIGLDIAKNVFHYAQLNRNGTVTGSGMLKRNKVLSHFAGLESAKVVMEACAGSHYWGRQLQECNHEVVLLPAHKVTPYVQGNKNDKNDALAIAEAAGRPGIRAVAVKTVEQQNLMMIHGLRQQTVQQRTQKRNAVRAHLSERGLTSRRGKSAPYALIESVITPVIPDRTFWNRAYQIALDGLAALVAPERIVICEGSPKTTLLQENHSLDAQCYEHIFTEEFLETKIVSMGSNRQIVGDQRRLAEALQLAVGGLDVVQLIDRDDRSEEEIANANKNGSQVLSRRNFKSYLFNDEVLRVLAARTGGEDKTDELVAQKTFILNNRKEEPPDNLKSASGEIYVKCKKILSLTQCGNTIGAFMRDTLAPLVKPGMSVYEELNTTYSAGIHDSYNSDSVIKYFLISMSALSTL